MTLETKKQKIVKAEPRIKWGKLKKENCCEEFREEIRRALGGKEELPDDWTTTAKVVSDTARQVLEEYHQNKRKEDKETSWWDEEVQESIRKKRLAKLLQDIVSIGEIEALSWKGRTTGRNGEG